MNLSTKLLIVRHGNTFDKGHVIRRVGKGTDLPLSMSGVKQAVQLGNYLSEHHPQIDSVFASTLQRTQQTTKHALETMLLDKTITCSDIFDEVDYGPDEGKPEEEVIERVGVEALKMWDENAVPPDGWNVDPEKIKAQWHDFARELTQQVPQTTMVVTSNGVARFAGDILLESETFMASEDIKLRTAAVGCFVFDGKDWHCEYWNRR